jgi:L-ascorbate metabolism protein UlaG (beta-lactamase superfamily)
VRFRLQVTYIGGPTALLELGGLRLLTDPTFDPGGSEYRTPIYVLRKTQGPALSPEMAGAVDAVLLSHDHHFDNLDHAGRRVLGTAARVLTMVAGAGRLGDNAIGLAPWQSHDLPARFAPGVALLFAGAARVPEVGPAHLTLTAAEAVTAAQIFPEAIIVPLHFEGWAHFSESRAEIDHAFAAAGLADRLRWPIPGQALELLVTS